MDSNIHVEDLTTDIKHSDGSLDITSECDWALTADYAMNVKASRRLDHQKGIHRRI